MENNIKAQVHKVKLSAPKLSAGTVSERNAALLAVAEALSANKEKIFAANREDMERSEKEGIPGPVLKRLKFDEGKLRDVINGINDLIKMEDPLFQVQLARELDEGLSLYRETCPIGVIGVIFEARPDALVQISALCIKSGNCVVLKGGSEALLSNRILFTTIYDAVLKAGLQENGHTLALVGHQHCPVFAAVPQAEGHELFQKDFPFRFAGYRYTSCWHSHSRLPYGRSVPASPR